MKAATSTVALILLHLVLLPMTTDPLATLAGSPESMTRQHAAALTHGFEFAHSPVDIARLVHTGQLVPVPGNEDYQIAAVEFAFAHPAARAFIERIARDYRQECGEPLIVTSLVRPIARQPRNAHPLSVHPAGMAVDLRIPQTPECRQILEMMLIALEARGVIDATLERRPPHFHIAVFPAAYMFLEERIARDSARAVEPDVLEEALRGWQQLPAGVWWAFGGLLVGIGIGGVGVRRWLRRGPLGRRKGDGVDDG